MSISLLRLQQCQTKSHYFFLQKEEEDFSDRFFPSLIVFQKKTKKMVSLLSGDVVFKSVFFLLVGFPNCGFTIFLNWNGNDSDQNITDVYHKVAK